MWSIWNDREERLNIGIIVLYGLLAMVTLFVTVWGIILVTQGMRYATAGLFGRVEAEVQIESAASRIPNYDHFFNLCASVQKAEAGLDAQYGALDGAESVKERERIRANIAGLQVARLGGIYQYNVDARKDYTKGRFRDSDLPWDLPETEYDHTEGVHTSCGYD